MKRKMLISIALVFIMLLNCIMPLIPVHADVSEGDIVLNTKLYKAVKSELMAQNIPFTYNDTAKSISIEPEVMAQITKMNLNNKGLYDISGLENFTALKHLELSNNNLSEDSNLGCLSSLPLEHLDLSTNKVGDVSDIDELISTIQSKNGKVILANQIVTVTAMSQVSEDGTIQVELPKILSKAGFIKSLWKTVTTDGPSIVAWPDRVSAEGTSLEFNTNRSGLLKLEIYIYDNPTEAASAANLNKAAENMLYQSRFFIYVVVHPEEQTPIYIPDVNMYNEIKRQLTQGHNGLYVNREGNVAYDNYVPNKDLASYPYLVDEDGNILYDECTFEEDGEKIYLTLIGDTARKYVIENEVVYLLNPDGTKDAYTKNYEQTIIYSVDATGNISQKLGYKIPLNGENETLYEKAYDEPQIFVIKDATLMNKITSLILNNKQIRDISGIEYFVGLKSDLNLSQNYLTNIDPLYKLQENKDIYEGKLQDKYNSYLKDDEFSLNEYLNETTTAKDAADGNIESIKTLVEEIIKKFDEAAEISDVTEDGEPDPKYSENLKKKSDEINKLVDQIHGTAEDPTNGLLDQLVENLSDAEDGLDGVYSLLSILYDIYNNEYKLLTMLSDELNYMDIIEYEELQEKLKNREEAEKLVTEQISVLKGFETNDSFTHFEELMLSRMYGIVVNDEERSVAKVLGDVKSPSYIADFTKMALYSEMVNYCTIKRMETEDVAEDQCFCREYLVNRIREFEYEGILTGVPLDPSEDLALEYELLEKIEELDKYVEEYLADPDFTSGDAIFDLYIEYFCKEIVYSDGTDEIKVEPCTGEYEKVTDLGYDDEARYTYAEIYAELENQTVTTPGGTAYPNAAENTQYMFDNLSGYLPKDINLYEYIQRTFKGEANYLYLYEEAVKIATRLVNSDVERYVILPDLKKLDISNNADLEGIEKISELTTLREFYANADYLGNIQDVDWEALKYVRKLGLAYNYITDISCLNVLDHLVDLDVSHNLLAGTFNFSFDKSQDTLKNLDLSYNQLDDITVIQEYLDIITGGRYANFLANENTLNINLNNQNLNIKVEEPINIKEFPYTVNIEMPKIFTQLLAIDTERTSFGITSEEGRIESEGTYVTLNTLTEGEKTAKVNVVAQSGNGTPVETCVGKGTTATITYKVVSPKVTEVKITPSEDVVVKAGEELQLTAEVVGENLFSTDVVWTIRDNQSENTTISNQGVLKVADDETAETIVVEAKSKDDGSKVATIVVSTKDIVPENPGTDPENPGTDPENPGTEPENPGTDPENPGTDPENPGTDPENPGTDPENPGTDPENPGTDPENPGTDPENPGTDPENPGTDPENPGTDPEVDVIDTATLGYKAGEEYLTDVKAKTSVEDFSRVLLNGKEYSVVIKKEDKDGNKTVVTEGNVATGMYVQVQDENGNVIKDQNGDLVVYEIVVKGDVNGDGLANSLDSILIKAHRNEVTDLSGSAIAAADINDDGKVNVSDSKLLLYHRAEVTGYDLNFKK